MSQNILKEVSDVLLEENLNYVLTVVNKFTPASARPKCLDVMFGCIYGELERGSLPSNRAIILKDKLISLCNTDKKDHLAILTQWISDNSSSPLQKIYGLPNITERWKLTIKVL